MYPVRITGIVTTVSEFLCVRGRSTESLISQSTALDPYLRVRGPSVSLASSVPFRQEWPSKTVSLEPMWESFLSTMSTTSLTSSLLKFLLCERLMQSSMLLLSGSISRVIFLTPSPPSPREGPLASRGASIGTSETSERCSIDEVCTTALTLH